MQFKNEVEENNQATIHFDIGINRKMSASTYRVTCSRTASCTNQKAKDCQQEGSSPTELRSGSQTPGSGDLWGGRKSRLCC